MAPQSWHPQVCVVQDCCFVEPLVKLSGRERDTFLRTVNIRSIPLIRPPPACLTWFASARGTWKPKTRHTYRSVLDRMVYPGLGDRTLSTLRPMDMSRWTAELADRVSPSQVRQAYRLISQIMKSAVENDILGQSPCRGLRLPRLPESDPKIPTVEQVAALAEQCAPPDRVLVLLLAYGASASVKRSRSGAEAWMYQPAG
jgi:hypothetical protein